MQFCSFPPTSFEYLLCIRPVIGNWNTKMGSTIQSRIDRQTKGYSSGWQSVRGTGGWGRVEHRSGDSTRRMLNTERNGRGCQTQKGKKCYNNVIFSKSIPGLSLLSWQEVYTWSALLLVPQDPVKVPKGLQGAHFADVQWL